jgi:lysophospholipase L1-like esterase
MAAPARFVGLGDSYTIGTSVGAEQRWPNQLVRRLGPDRLELVANLAINGSAASDVFREQVPDLARLRPDLVTLLVGVNDVVRRVPEASYREALARIVDAIRGLDPAPAIVAVTTPDYTVTPAGGAFGDPTQQSHAIRRFNAILAEEAASRDIPVADIYEASLAAGVHASLVAMDGLHPSGAQYSRWVDLIAPVVEALLVGRLSS